VEPNRNLSSLDQGPDGAGVYSYEVCDACEADDFGYKIDGTLVSDFVYPEWFESFHPKGSTRFDHSSKIDEPFQLLSGGYIGVNDIGSGLGWNQLVADQTFNVRSAPPSGRRRQRRDVPPAKRQVRRVSRHTADSSAAMTFSVSE